MYIMSCNVKKIQRQSICVVNSGYQSEMVIFELLLNTFVSYLIFIGNLGQQEKTGLSL
jgi:hypothetical protein